MERINNIIANQKKEDTEELPWNGTRTEVPNLKYVYGGRMICTVLEELRTCLRTMNFNPMKALIEEAQILANRMEAALDVKNSIEELYKEIHDLKQVRKKLHEECTETRKRLDEIWSEMNIPYEERKVNIGEKGNG